MAAEFQSVTVADEDGAPHTVWVRVGAAWERGIGYHNLMRTDPVEGRCEHLDLAPHLFGWPYAEKTNIFCESVKDEETVKCTSHTVSITAIANDKTAKYLETKFNENIERADAELKDMEEDDKFEIEEIKRVDSFGIKSALFEIERQEKAIENLEKEIQEKKNQIAEHKKYVEKTRKEREARTPEQIEQEIAEYKKNSVQQAEKYHNRKKNMKISLAVLKKIRSDIAS